jgi:glucose/arabinose dehydrogenase
MLAEGHDMTRASRTISIALCAACLTVATVDAQLRMRVEASGFTLPVAAVQDPTDRSVWFVVQQNGIIRAVRNGVIVSPDFLDVSASIVSGGEQGLLDLAFMPDTSRRFFVNFTNRSGDSVIARFRRAPDSLTADVSTRFDLRWNGAAGPAWIEQPFANHNGGHLAFGPDGYLYIGLGDGGAADDPGNRAQTGSELLGKMLRIDVNVPDSHPIGYQIPPDNPYLGGRPVAARPEIWAFGLRNPWRYNFDDPTRGGTGALLIADVGQNRYEEVDYQPPARGARNYGWRNREGLHDEVSTTAPAYLPLIEPIHEYDHSVGQSITGGYVYRGTALARSFQGRYFFADFVAGRVWSLALTIDPSSGEARASNVIEHTAELGGSGALGNISSFAVDADGELYIVSYAGRLLKIVGPASPPTAPTALRIIR